jgi:hypothetical protein
MIRFLLPAAFAAAALCAPCPASATRSETLSIERLERSAAPLRAGHYVWAPARAATGPVEIVIGLAEQRAWVFRGGTLIGVTTISSGMPGRESPIGRFQILEKKRDHRSNRYNDAPMPFMQRLNWYGVALHGGHVPNRPASRGCIRLPMGFARALFGATELGGFVYVTEERVGTAARALGLARANEQAPMPADRLPGWTRRAAG